MTPALAFIIASIAGTAITSIVIPVLVAALTAAVALVLTRASEAANRRRDQYAAAVATLVAWIEFPYRVRRRTSNEPATLTPLTGIGHDLQERLACHEAWIATESRGVASVYTQARTAIARYVAEALQEAWEADPITDPQQMNLGAWGPNNACAPHVAEVQQAATTRFGWERFKGYLSPGGTHPRRATLPRPRR